MGGVGGVGGVPDAGRLGQRRRAGGRHGWRRGRPPCAGTRVGPDLTRREVHVRSTRISGCCAAFAHLWWVGGHRSCSAPSPAADENPLRILLPQVLPALVVGVVASLLFLGIEALAEELEGVLWHDLPDALGIGDYSSLWIISMLTAAGIAVGLVIWKFPGHAGPDPASEGLGGAPLAPGIVPGLLLASTLSLALGVSLGPENPIIASNVALAYWLGRKAAPAVPGAFWISLASAATIGALFGTPVAAALVLSEALTGMPGRGSLWDRLFAPLVAAGAAP